MSHVNMEIKARCPDPDRVRTFLRARDARFVGTDHQVDTYFRCPKGRLKLRQGPIETALIQYHRADSRDTRASNVHLYKTTDSAALRELLSSALEIDVVVRKQREIFFIDNVKFHIDNVEGLGSFVEIEAIGEFGEEERLRAQCDLFRERLGVEEGDIEGRSYSDLLRDPDGASG